MLSEQEPATDTPASSSWDWLFSQGLGLLCGQATVLLLAIGSVVLSATRGGASAMIGMDDIRGFFTPYSPVHTWFYLLIPVLGLYGLNTLLATCRSVLRKWRAGARFAQAYAPSVIHLAFLFSLVAHLIGGLGSGETGQVLLGPGWMNLDEKRQARVTELEIERLPDGGTKQVWATIETRDTEGRVATSMVSYNGPLSSGLGSDLFLLIRPMPVSVAELQLQGPEARCALQLDAVCQLGELQVSFLYLQPPTKGSRSALARLRVGKPAGGPSEAFWLSPGQRRKLADGSILSFEGLTTQPAVLMRGRHAPGNPWALLASILLGLGLVMMWRRFLPAKLRVRETPNPPTADRPQ
jgi:hypothetical protein